MSNSTTLLLAEFTWLVVFLLVERSDAFHLPTVRHPQCYFTNHIVQQSCNYGTIGFKIRRNVVTTNHDTKREEQIPLDDEDVTIREPLVVAESSSECELDEESVLQFLEMVQLIPPGELEEEESSLLRELLLSAVSNEKHSVTTEKEITIMESLLFRMVDEWLATKNTKVEPSVQDFAATMRAWEQLVILDAETNKRNTNSLPKAVRHVQELFYSLEDLFEKTGNTNIRPNREIFQIALRVMGMSREPGIDRKAEHIFDRMSLYDLEPDPSTYESMIILLAKSRHRNAANRAEKMLREAVQRFPPSPNSSSEQGMGMAGFNAVITAWAKSGVEYGPERAEKMIQLMDGIGLSPSMVTLTSLIDAYAQLNSWDGIGQSERILNRIIDLYLDGDESFQPSIVTWTVVMSAWCRLARKGFKGAAARADRLLRRLETLHEEGRMSFGPDAIAYITVMNANAFSKTAEGLTRATEILDEMNERWLDGDESFKPTPRSIRMLVDFWVKNSAEDRMTHAEDILERYAEHIDPAEISDDKARMDLSEIHKSMIFGYCQTGEPDLAQNHLQELYDNNLDIDALCLCRIIDSNAQLNDADAMTRSVQVLELMEKSRLECRITPNERVYTSFIRAMTKARIPNLAQKAHAMLIRMDDMLAETGNPDIKPTIYTYNAVIFACSETESEASEDERKQALKIAVSIFNEIRKLTEVGDPFTFGNMLRCAKLLQPGEQKDQFIRSIFQECSRQGLVSEFILRDLKEFASDGLVKSLFDGCTIDDIDIERLPSAWKQNVDQTRRRIE
jgi:hypothetical protein